MTQLNEVWSQGSAPGDPPISSVEVPVDAAFAARQDATARMRAFARGPRPNGAPSPQQQIHDLAVSLGFAEA